MSQNVGFIYGKAKEKKLVVSAGNHINEINITRSSINTFTISSSNAYSLTVSPAEAITLSAIMPPDNMGATVYHDGVMPKEGNYYYTPSTIYTFDSWKDSNDNVVSTDTTYVFNMPIQDLSLTANAIESIQELNKIFSIALSISNESPDDIDSVEIDSGSFQNNGTIYRWPNQGNITITATLKPNGLEGPYYTDDDDTARPDAYMWYIENARAITEIVDSNGTSTNASSLTINPSTAMSYSIYASATRATVSSKKALNSTVTSYQSASTSTATKSLTYVTRNTYSQWITGTAKLTTTGTMYEKSLYTTFKYYWSSTSETKCIQTSSSFHSYNMILYSQGATNIIKNSLIRCEVGDLITSNGNCKYWLVVHKNTSNRRVILCAYNYSMGKYNYDTYREHIGNQLGSPKYSLSDISKTLDNNSGTILGNLSNFVVSHSVSNAIMREQNGTYSQYSYDASNHTLWLPTLTNVGLKGLGNISLSNNGSTFDYFKGEDAQERRRTLLNGSSWGLADGGYYWSWVYGSRVDNNGNHTIWDLWDQKMDIVPFVEVGYTY